MVQKLVAYEDALSMIGWGKFNVLICILCSGVISGMVFEMYSVSYVVPGSACELGTTSTQQGLAAGLPLAGVIAASHLWGYLADKYGRRNMLIFSMGIGFLTGTLATFSPNWIVLCTLKFLSSAAVSGAPALAVALLGECTPLKQRSLVLLLTTSVFLTCTGIMAALSIPILPLTFSYYIPILDIYFNSWRLLNLIFCIPCAVFCLGAICCFESPKFLLSTGEDEQALEVMKFMFEMNTGKSSDLYQVKSLFLDEETISSAGMGIWSSIVAQTVPMFKKPLLRGTLILGLLFSMVFICANTFVVWFPFIADAFISSVEAGSTGLAICEMIRKDRSEYNTTSSVDMPQNCAMNEAAMSMVCGISFILAFLNVATGLLINCIGKRRLYIGIQMLSGVAALCINVSPLWTLSAALLLTLMLDVLNFGFLSSFTVDLFPTFVKAKAVCLMLMLGRGFTILGINVFKLLIENNCEAAFYTFGAITISAGLLGLLLPPDPAFNLKFKKVTVQPDIVDK